MGSDGISYDEVSRRLASIRKEIRKVIVGQEKTVDQLLASLLADGNVLMESNPGMGKTKLASTTSKVLGMEFSRIQSTPDLMPSDITGTHIIEESGDDTKFVFRQGPIFANMVLADEINRATPKTQSALLEAMQEKQVTVGNNSYPLEEPFFLVATQNPIEQEGTYPLPEAQRDRFMMKIVLDYPDAEQENEIVDRFTADLERNPDLKEVVSKEDLKKMQEYAYQVPAADDIKMEAVKIVRATRRKSELEYGASPRAAIDLVSAAKAQALLNDRNHVSVEDIETMAKPVLRHRIGLSFGAEKEGKQTEDVLEEIIGEV